MDRHSAQLILDLAVFITPGLLPVAIMLHTFSEEKVEDHDQQPSTVVEQGDGLTPKQIAVEKWMAENGIYNSDDEMEAAQRAESAGVAIAAIPLERSNGHGQR